MQATEELLTSAEIAAALIGFSGLISAFRARSVAELEARGRGRAPAGHPALPHQKGSIRCSITAPPTHEPSPIAIISPKRSTCGVEIGHSDASAIRFS